MRLQKIRWSKVYESTEEELVNFLQARNITAERHTCQEFQEIEDGSLAQAITIWCAEGSFTMHIGNDQVSMQPGDALRIPTGVTFTLTAGMSGCVYYKSVSS